MLQNEIWYNAAKGLILRQNKMIDSKYIMRNTHTQTINAQYMHNIYTRTRTVYQSRRHSMHLFLPRFSKVDISLPHSANQLRILLWMNWHLDSLGLDSYFFLISPSLHSRCVFREFNLQVSGYWIRFVGWTMLNREVSNKVWKRCEKMKVFGKMVAATWTLTW